MKTIIKQLEELSSYLSECDGVSHKSDDLDDIIDQLKIKCDMPRSQLGQQLVQQLGNRKYYNSL